MNRDYTTGVSNSARFFIGTEVEHTPAYGLKTLFVVGVKPATKILKYAQQHKVEHIYFGANQSFSPKKDSDWQRWEDMIMELLNAGYLCTLDVDLRYVDRLSDTKMSEITTFIPMISVKFPHIKMLNLNATVKIDDVDFNSTNPGVWCHPLSELTKKRFTDWSKYTSDQILE